MVGSNGLFNIPPLDQKKTYNLSIHLSSIIALTSAN
jgi:hypothetical protein